MESEAIEEAAARWLVRKDGDGWTPADQLQLEAWLEESTAHRIAFVRLQAAWKHSARMTALGAGVPRGVIPERGSWGDVAPLGQLPESALAGGTAAPAAGNPASASPRSRGAVRRYWPAAAAILLALCAGLYGYDPVFFRGERYSTAVGDQETVALADGSRVILNTNSRIRVALTEPERRVELHRGEAFFDVAKDETRPFVVLAGDQRVVVVGTKFAVRRHSEDVEVLVTEGRVRLERTSAGSVQPPVQLRAGAVARTAHQSVIVREDAVPEIEQRLSWRSGYVSFRDTALVEAVAEFNRYTKRKIVIGDASIAAMRIGGNFRSDNEAAFLWLLENGFPVEVEDSEEQVVLRSR